MQKSPSLNICTLSNAVKRLVNKAPLALLAVVFLTSLSCGKRRAPQPPVERVPQRVEAAGFQRGNQVILSWKMPARNAPAGSILNISRADIYRLAEPLKLPAGTRFSCTAYFDNSEGNLNNPNPKTWVRWGSQTWEEMMIGYFDVAIPLKQVKAK